jgi:hypothetical protein
MFIKRISIILLIVVVPLSLFSQGLKHVWLLGNQYNLSTPKGRMLIDASSYSYQQEIRKMVTEGTQATISDEQGNFLMSSNGVWIANANNDTMLNGNGLNPGYFVNSWSHGLPIFYGNIFLPTPDDINTITLIHQTELDPNSTLMGIYRTVIDKSLDTGLGGVVIKNDTLVEDSLAWGIGACKHANGQDWWIVFMKDNSDIIYKVLLGPNGITSISTQSLGFLPITSSNGAQLTFSQDGKKLVYSTYDNPVDRNSYVVLMDFDRCSGNLFNTQTVLVSTGAYLWGLAYSSSGEYIYACNSGYVFQINSNTLTIDTVAMYDGFISGSSSCCPTTFWNMYLAANGKIYTTSGSSVQHLHEMNFPDSAGLSCDFQQHAINLGIWNFRSVPNHPNYYLSCDTNSTCICLTTGIEETAITDFNLQIAPNPNDGNFKISYLLPQNSKGRLEIFNMEGKVVLQMHLPQWSTMQQIKLPSDIASGVYTCSIVASGKITYKKLAIIKP